MSEDVYEVTLTSLVYGGEALGRLPDQRAVFVPFGIPGERVRIRLVDEKRGFARGELIEVLQAASERIAAKCRHFGLCGGCHYQHMSYEAQLKAKAGILRDQFQRIGKIESPPVKATVACPMPWNYRNHLQFHLTADGRPGFVRAGDASSSSQSIFPITECHLPEEPIDALWPQLEFEPGIDIQRVSIRGNAGGELMLALESDSPNVPELEIEADISVTHIFDEQTVVIAGDSYIMMHASGRDFRVSAASFFQVNTAMTEKMVAYLMEKLSWPAEIFLDVYCGVGLFSAVLAPKCKRLIGIESSPSACEDFTGNLDEFDNVELYEGLAEDILPKLDVKPDIALVDPPRAGLERRALDAIKKLAPRLIAYVSCDPSTLARDARRLIDGGYHLTEATPFDLFPQTYHIESISLFER